MGSLTNMSRIMGKMEGRMTNLQGSLSMMGDRMIKVEGGLNSTYSTPQATYCASTRGHSHATSSAITPGTFHQASNQTPINQEEDDSTFIGKGSVKMEWDAYELIVTSSLCVPILRMSCDSLVYKVEAKLWNTLTEVHLCDTFSYYLFAYDDAHPFEWRMFLEVKSANQTKRGVLDPCSWIYVPFDPGNELNCGTCVVMLGRDDMHNLDEFVDTFPYDGKSLRVYNPLEWPMLCMRNSSFLNPFLYYRFVYDLVDCASYGGRN
ncbi:hypothetical protein KY290_023355 [Solanum tuberosum]|uniref:Uncharacterized protein n=1 Tax=Solanum tuberosum TaxID=4113 RepID=A0ABQ7V938_SOLTU|nr:hypothetical protein KY285_020239 [Solanum tuberosum]KAH0759862.1 hypothetical protein KY290_023355 [Solanum tuberosum]